MKNFLFGLFLGIGLSVLALAAQHRASEKVVEPQVVIENQKVRIVRWVLKPGEGSPIHTHKLDHIGCTIHGSTLLDVEPGGATKQNVEEDGHVEFVPGTGRTHSFSNIGKTSFESVSIELK